MRAGVPASWCCSGEDRDAFIERFWKHLGVWSQARPVAAAGFKVKGEAKADEPRKGDGSGTSEPAPAADVGDPVDPAPDADAKLDPPRRRRPGEGGTGRAPEHQRAAGGVLQGLARTVGAAAGVLADAPNAAAGVGGAAKAALTPSHSSMLVRIAAPCASQRPQLLGTHDQTHHMVQFRLPLHMGGDTGLPPSVP